MPVASNQADRQGGKGGEADKDEKRHLLDQQPETQHRPAAIRDKRPERWPVKPRQAW
jgi:hypothetical protein